ncbi:Fc.00g037380.m01.CDS01 [Cosmosporella sp. VM-42]
MWSNAVVGNALKLSMSQIAENIGFKEKAQLLTIPPYIVGGISAYFSGIVAECFTWRMPFLAASQFIVIAGYAMLFAKSSHIEHNVALCYFSITFASTGLCPIQPGTATWTANNLARPKRSLAIAFMICLGNLGDVFGSFIYKKSDQPAYPTGFGMSSGLQPWELSLASSLKPFTRTSTSVGMLPPRAKLMRSTPRIN